MDAIAWGMMSTALFHLLDVVQPWFIFRLHGAVIIFL